MSAGVVALLFFLLFLNTFNRFGTKSRFFSRRTCFQRQLFLRPHLFVLPYFLYLSRKRRDILLALLSWKAKRMSGTSVAGRRYRVLYTYLAKGEMCRSPVVFNVSFRNTQRKRVVSIIKKNHINVRRSSRKGPVSFVCHCNGIPLVTTSKERQIVTSLVVAIRCAHRVSKYLKIFRFGLM